MISCINRNEEYGEPDEPYVLISHHDIGRRRGEVPSPLFFHC
jgi:hypothetical protein